MNRAQTLALSPGLWRQAIDLLAADHAPAARAIRAELARLGATGDGPPIPIRLDRDAYRVVFRSLYERRTRRKP